MLDVIGNSFQSRQDSADIAIDDGNADAKRDGSNGGCLVYEKEKETNE